MDQLEIRPSDWKNYIGKEIGISDWYEVTQDEITKYGEIIGDMQWIHVDPERAKKESPYGTTVAHGNWVLSIAYPKLFKQLYIPINTRMTINYGWNKIRFPAPTPVGKRIRLVAKVVDVREIGDDAYDVEFDYKIYVEGESKPCFVALKLSRFYSH
ncbi:MAG: MaoC family dehydratase [Promethearchaeota archaeon]|nr:MAG: MaoC family dehydratase [Candidatus Lokiarchaeota archaeon]